MIWCKPVSWQWDTGRSRCVTGLHSSNTLTSAFQSYWIEHYEVSVQDNYIRVRDVHWEEPPHCILLFRSLQLWATAALPTDPGQRPHVIFTVPQCLASPPFYKTSKHNISTRGGTAEPTDVQQKQHCAAALQLLLSSQHCGGRAGRASETLRIVAGLQKVSSTWRRALIFQFKLGAGCSCINTAS